MTMDLGSKEFHIAPMLDVSTVEFRHFVRLLTRRAVIWNQMVVAETLVHRSRGSGGGSGVRGGGGGAGGGGGSHNRRRRRRRGNAGDDGDSASNNKESASCELPPQGSDEDDDVADPGPHDDQDHDHDDDHNDEDDDEGIELTPDLMRYCGWYDARDDGLLGVNPHPTVCQIGGNDPAEAAFATRVARACGYDAVDLNCECPSDRVAGRRCFGAALMKDRDAAVAVVSSMVRTANSAGGGDDHHRHHRKPLPVSVKTRIGVDDEEGFDFISNFVRRLVDAGCEHFVIHARKVYTEGLRLSPAQNRDVPPLDYPIVYRLMGRFPHCTFLVNGGVRGLVHAREVAYGSAVRFDEDGRGRTPAGDDGDGDGNGNDDRRHSVPCRICDLPRGSCLAPPRGAAPPNLRGVMAGRLARDRPADLADVDRYFYGEDTNPCADRRELMDGYLAFLERVYPRRCCDDDGAMTLGMARDATVPVVPKRPCCGVCREFRGSRGDGGDGSDDPGAEDQNVVAAMEDSVGGQPTAATDNNHSGKPQQQKHGKKRSRRHDKYGGAKIVTRIIDRALQPTLGILAGEQGNNAFRRACHELSRDKVVRNCGPAYILWRAMRVVPDEVWDRPFERCDGGGKRTTGYYPTK